MADHFHQPPDDGGRKPKGPPPKPKDAARSVLPPFRHYQEKGGTVIEIDRIDVEPDVVWRFLDRLWGCIRGR